MVCPVGGAFPPHWRTGKFSFSEDSVPAQISGFRHPVQRFSQIGREGMAIVQFIFGHNEFSIRVEHNEIRIVAGGQATLARVATG